MKEGKTFIRVNPIEEDCFNEIYESLFCSDTVQCPHVIQITGMTGSLIKTRQIPLVLTKETKSYSILKINTKWLEENPPKKGEWDNSYMLYYDLKQDTHSLHKIRGEHGLPECYVLCFKESEFTQYTSN